MTTRTMGEGSRRSVRRGWRRHLSRRVRLVFLGLTLAGAGATAGVTATTASANWSARLENVEFGWVNSYGRPTEFAWAQASDAALAQLGATRATSLACRAVTEDVPFFRFGCEYVVRRWVGYWISSEPRYIYHGHWVRFYPYESPHLQYGSY